MTDTLDQIPDSVDGVHKNGAGKEEQSSHASCIVDIEFHLADNTENRGKDNNDDVRDSNSRVNDSN